MLNRLVAGWLVVLLAACATTKPAFPPESDGLTLVPDSKLAAVYIKPGADLSQYNKIALLDTYVAVAKNWKRNYNEEATFQDRIIAQQMQEIRDKVAR